MAYGQMTRYRRSKRSYGVYRGGRSLSRRPYKKRRQQDGFDMARNAWNGVKKLYRMVNVEYKEHLAVQTGTTVNATGVLVDLSVIAQGDTGSTRDGISIKPINLTFRAQIEANVAATHTGFRIIIFRGKQENDQAMVIGDVLSTSAPKLLNPKIHDKRFKTKVLWDQLFAFSPQSGVTTKTIEKVFRLDGHIGYDASQVSGADKESGGLYMILISDQATNTPTIRYVAKLTYTDN